MRHQIQLLALVSLPMFVSGLAFGVVQSWDMGVFIELHKPLFIGKNDRMQRANERRTAAIVEVDRPTLSATASEKRHQFFKTSVCVRGGTKLHQRYNGLAYDNSPPHDQGTLTANELFLSIPTWTYTSNVSSPD